MSGGGEFTALGDMPISEKRKVDVAVHVVNLSHGCAHSPVVIHVCDECHNDIS
jgi:hypothetical protein